MHIKGPASQVIVNCWREFNIETIIIIDTILSHDRKNILTDFRLNINDYILLIW